MTLAADIRKTPMTLPKAGDPAPKFHLQDQNSNGWTLDDYADGWLVLYFYPADDTPGCTKEACAFRDTYSAFKDSGAKVVGVSPDTTDSHARFVDKYDLTFNLLADPTHETADAYGVWETRERHGQKVSGVRRTTFLIAPDGIIAKVYENVAPDAHAEEVLADVRTLAQTRTA